MRFTETAIGGVRIIETEPNRDERGSMVRLFDRDLFAAHGVDTQVEQVSLSVNAAPRTLRGLHLQREPHGEHKLVRCLTGRAHDVLVDLRAGSPSFAQWIGVDLQGQISVAIPPGVAHGFVTLEPDTQILYHISAAHEPSASVGLRWDDPDIGIRWPVDPEVLSPRDRALPVLDELMSTLEGG